MATIKVNVAAYNRFLNQVVQPYLVKKAQEIADQAQANAPKDTGDLASSVTVEKGARGGAIVNVNSPHAGFVHQGTGPQHQPSPRAPYFPPTSRSLITWSIKRGLNPRSVAYGISKRGTPPDPFLEKAIVAVLSKFRFRWIKRDLET